MTERTFSRFDRLAAHMAAMPPAAKADLVALLDTLSVPMSARELEFALADCGMSRTVRRPLVNALKGHVILIARKGSSDGN